MSRKGNNNKKTPRKQRGRGGKPGRRQRGNDGPRPKKNGGWSVPGRRQTIKHNFLLGSGGGLMDLCCRNVNPFDPHCEGCKLPDGQNSHSIALSHRLLDTRAVGTYGNLMMSIFGALPYSILYYTATSASTYNSDATFSSVSPPTIFTGNANAYRLVCWGVRVRVVSAVPDTSGQIIFTRISTSPALNATGLAGGYVNGNDVEIVPCVTGASYIFLGRRISMPRWYSQGTNTQLWLNNAEWAWDGLNLEVTGATASKTTISVELIYHIEFTSSTSSGLYMIAPQDPPANPAAMAAIQSVQQHLPTVHTGSSESLSVKVRDLVKSRARAAARNAAALAGDMALEGLGALLP